jgi:predicted DNA-binding protein (MmcQ/YjbR family)
MTFGDLRDHCIAKPGVTEGFPFGDSALVMKVESKMFALISMDEIPVTVSLKCDPERAERLRARYAAVQPGYHLNKRHWNTITVDGSLVARELRGLIDHSYDLVVAGLPAASRARLAPVAPAR